MPESLQMVTRTHLKNTYEVKILLSWAAKTDDFMCATNLLDISRNDH